MAFLDTIKLAFHNNLIIGNSSNDLKMETISDKALKDAEAGVEMGIESFGLFDSNQSNYNTYYPDLKVEDLQPKDNEFIQPVFRALSEVIVHKNFNPVDFGVGNILKKSLSLLKGQTINADHETAIGNALGAVVDTFWEQSYKTKNGVLVPAGINAKLKIDGKSHPRIARAVMMDPPAIHSTSVTVQFMWDKSHDLPADEFFSKLGTMDKDGKMVRRIATQVKKYNEISLVSHGADPFAQKIGSDGKEIVNPQYANITYNAEQKKAQKYFSFDFKSDLIQNSENNTIPEETNNDTSTSKLKDMNPFLIALSALIGVEVDAENPDQAVIQNAITKLVADKAALTTSETELKAENERLIAIETKYNADSAALAEAVLLKEFKDKQTTSLRAEVTRLYSAVAGDKAQAPITDLIKNANFETLSALNLQYTAQLEEKMPMSCKKCGSTEVNRATAAQLEEDNNTNNAPKDNESVARNLQHRKQRASGALSNFHGQDATKKDSESK